MLHTALQADQNSYDADSCRSRGAPMDLGVAPGARLLAGHRERIFANAPFRADNRVRSRARLRAVLDPEYGRVRMWRNKRRINGRPSDARGLPRIIAALDEHGTCG